MGFLERREREQCDASLIWGWRLGGASPGHGIATKLDCAFQFKLAKHISSEQAQRVSGCCLIVRAEIEGGEDGQNTYGMTDFEQNHEEHKREICQTGAGYITSLA